MSEHHKLSNVGELTGGGKSVAANVLAVGASNRTFGMSIGASACAKGENVGMFPSKPVGDSPAEIADLQWLQLWPL